MSSNTATGCPPEHSQRLATLVFRAELDDVAKTAMHRPEFFGRWFNKLLGSVMRGPSYWTVAEREYMAVCTSRLNDCPFCVRVHAETTRIESDGALDVDRETSGRPELAAVLAFLEKVSRTPDAVTARDVDVLRAAGVPDVAIADALHVNVIFNTVNRMANALGWEWDSDHHVRADARALHLFRYSLPSFVLR